MLTDNDQTRKTLQRVCIVLLSTFGGLALFGAVGLVIGPVIAALFLAMRQICSDKFGDLLLTAEDASDEA